mmetsp:Transcript_43656/g.135850  ORF Transcript_43656/g.135850 Transcript_43656/m.135850 type:complete len:503 (+) Transcript_43656:50-1558(+)
MHAGRAVSSDGQNLIEVHRRKRFWLRLRHPVTTHVPVEFLPEDQLVVVEGQGVGHQVGPLHVGPAEPAHRRRAAERHQGPRAGVEAGPPVQAVGELIPHDADDGVLEVRPAEVDAALQVRPVEAALQADDLGRVFLGAIELQVQELPQTLGRGPERPPELPQHLVELGDDAQQQIGGSARPYEVEGVLTKQISAEPPFCGRGVPHWRGREPQLVKAPNGEHEARGRGRERRPLERVGLVPPAGDDRGHEADEHQVDDHHDAAREVAGQAIAVQGVDGVQAGGHQRNPSQHGSPSGGGRRAPEEAGPGHGGGAEPELGEEQDGGGDIQDHVHQLRLRLLLNVLQVAAVAAHALHLAKPPQHLQVAQVRMADLGAHIPGLVGAEVHPLVQHEQAPLALKHERDHGHDAGAGSNGQNLCGGLQAADGAAEASHEVHLHPLHVAPLPGELIRPRPGLLDLDEEVQLVAGRRGADGERVPRPVDGGGLEEGVLPRPEREVVGLRQPE